MKKNENEAASGEQLVNSEAHKLALKVVRELLTQNGQLTDKDIDRHTRRLAVAITEKTEDFAFHFSFGAAAALMNTPERQWPFRIHNERHLSTYGKECAREWRAGYDWAKGGAI